MGGLAQHVTLLPPASVSSPVEWGLRIPLHTSSPFTPREKLSRKMPEKREAQKANRRLLRLLRLHNRALPLRNPQSGTQLSSWEVGLDTEPTAPAVEKRRETQARTALSHGHRTSKS